MFDIIGAKYDRRALQLPACGSLENRAAGRKMVKEASGRFGTLCSVWLMPGPPRPRHRRIKHWWPWNFGLWHRGLPHTGFLECARKTGRIPFYHQLLLRKNIPSQYCGHYYHRHRGTDHRCRRGTQMAAEPDDPKSMVETRPLSGEYNTILVKQRTNPACWPTSPLPERLPDQHCFYQSIGKERRNRLHHHRGDEEITGGHCRHPKHPRILIALRASSYGKAMNLQMEVPC